MARDLPRSTLGSPPAFAGQDRVSRIQRIKVQSNLPLRKSKCDQGENQSGIKVESNQIKANQSESNSNFFSNSGGEVPGVVGIGVVPPSDDHWPTAFGAPMFFHRPSHLWTTRTQIGGASEFANSDSRTPRRPAASRNQKLFTRQSLQTLISKRHRTARQTLPSAFFLSTLDSRLLDHSDELKRVADELVDEFDDIYPIDTQHV